MRFRNSLLLVAGACLRLDADSLPVQTTISVLAPDSVPSGDTVTFSAVVRDASGLILRFPDLQWRATGPGRLLDNNGPSVRAVLEGPGALAVSASLSASPALAPATQNRTIRAYHPPSQRTRVRASPAFDSLFVGDTGFISALVSDGTGVERQEVPVRWALVGPIDATQAGVQRVAVVPRTSGAFRVAAIVDPGPRREGAIDTVLARSAVLPQAVTACALSWSDSLRGHVEVTTGQSLFLTLRCRRPSRQLRTASIVFDYQSNGNGANSALTTCDGQARLGRECYAFSISLAGTEIVQDARLSVKDGSVSTRSVSVPSSLISAFDGSDVLFEVSVTNPLPRITGQNPGIWISRIAVVMSP